MRLRVGDQVFHHLADVLDIKASSVECAVGGDGGEYLANRLNAALTRALGTFNDECGGAHADDQSVAAAVEGNGGLGNNFVRGGSSAGEEAGAHPVDQMVGGDVVGGDDDHAAATAGADPVLRQRNRLRGGRAGRVELRIWTPGPDEFGELRMPHRQGAQQETALEDVGGFVNQGAQFRDPLIQFLPDLGIAVAIELDAQALKNRELVAASLVSVVACHFVSERIQARERRCKNHPGIVAEGVGQGPAIRQLRAFAGFLVAHYQRYAGVAQCIEPGGDGELGVAVERCEAIGGNAEFRFQIEIVAAAGKLDDVRYIINRFETRISVLALYQARDVLVEHALAKARGEI